jgi:hypothetical protein
MCVKLVNHFWLVSPSSRTATLDATPTGLPQSAKGQSYRRLGAERSRKERARRSALQSVVPGIIEHETLSPLSY